MNGATELVTGTLKRFDANRGFGFVEFPDLPDAFLPIPPLREAHVERMRPGAPMKCEIIKTEKGARVTKVLWIDNSQSDKPLIRVWYRRIVDVGVADPPMIATRTALPQRRFCETTELLVPGQRAVFAVTVGRYHDGRVGEVFVSGAKAGSEVDAVARDGAILLSIALQHGVPLDAFRTALTRNLDGTPSSIIGAVVDQLTNGGRP